MNITAKIISGTMNSGNTRKLVFFHISQVDAEALLAETGVAPADLPALLKVGQYGKYLPTAGCSLVFNPEGMPIGITSYQFTDGWEIGQSFDIETGTFIKAGATYVNKAGLSKAYKTSGFHNLRAFNTIAADNKRAKMVAAKDSLLPLVAAGYSTKVAAAIMSGASASVVEMLMKLEASAPIGNNSEVVAAQPANKLVTEPAEKPLLDV